MLNYLMIGAIGYAALWLASRSRGAYTLPTEPNGERTHSDWEYGAIDGDPHEVLRQMGRQSQGGRSNDSTHDDFAPDSLSVFWHFGGDPDIASLQGTLAGVLWKLAEERSK